MDFGPLVALSYKGMTKMHKKLRISLINIITEVEKENISFIFHYFFDGGECDQ